MQSFRNNVLHKALGAMPWVRYGSQWWLPMDLIIWGQKGSENRQDAHQWSPQFQGQFFTISPFRQKNVYSFGHQRWPVKSHSKDRGGQRWRGETSLGTPGSLHLLRGYKKELGELHSLLSQLAMERLVLSLETRWISSGWKQKLHCSIRKTSKSPPSSQQLSAFVQSID